MKDKTFIIKLSWFKFLLKIVLSVGMSLTGWLIIRNFEVSPVNSYIIAYLIGAIATSIIIGIDDK